jgi:hypothetical protein
VTSHLSIWVVMTDVCVLEGYEFDVGFGKVYGDVQPFGSRD